MTVGDRALVEVTGGNLSVGINNGTGTLIVSGSALISVASNLTLGNGTQSLVDVANNGRMSIGQVGTAPGAGEIRVGSGGSILGSGTVVGNIAVEQGGSISPGFSPGQIGITGGLSLFNQATLTMEIGGVTPDLFDMINVTGAVALDGALVIRFINGFTPSRGASFDIVTSGGGFSGSFGEVRFEKVASGTITTGYANGRFTVAAVPEPGVASLLLCGVLLGARRKSQTKEPRLEQFSGPRPQLERTIQL